MGDREILIGKEKNWILERNMVFEKVEDLMPENDKVIDNNKRWRKERGY